MKFKNKISFLLASAMLFSVMCAQETDENILKGLEFINAEDTYNTVKVLSSPKYEGRHTGHQGYTAAAKWAAGMFKKWGLNPIHDEGYLQPFESPYTKADESFNIIRRIREKRRRMALKI
ncbi:MAG: hypothetical protein ACOC5S_04875 [Acidobacteriota bacterium]